MLLYNMQTCFGAVYAPVDRADMSGRAKDPLDHAEMMVAA